MNITFVITTLTGGGAERVASVLCSEWANEGHNVNIILTSKNAKNDRYQVKGVNVFELSPKKRISVFKKIKLVRKILIKTDTQITVSFFPNSSFIVQKAMRGLNILSFVSERNDPSYKKGLFQRLLRKITFKKAAGIVFQTENIRKMFDSNVQAKSTIISNPFSPMLKVLEPKNEVSKTIVAVGRLVKQKRFDYLIKAFKNFSFVYTDYFLNIYGSGPEKTILDELIKTNNLSNKVTIKSFTDNVLEKINQCDIFVMPSLFEGFPNALMEAVVLQKPCVVSDFSSGSAQCLVENNFNGMVVDLSAEPIVFGSKIGEVVENIESFKNGAKIKSEEILKKNDSKVIASEWINFFEAKYNGK